MPDFYKQYRFADNDAPIQDWDQFLNIRIGARLIKDTGDEYQKTDNHVYEKVPRQFLSNADIEGKFAVLDGTNTFTDPQYCTAEPTEPYHIVNKEYVDALLAAEAVDLSGFARLDRENIWEQPQVCDSEPETRAHLANKGYVDDRINEIEFDTAGLARLNTPNTFTAPQSVTVESTAPEHLVSKQYVDGVRDSIINNITGFVRVDLPNTFTATQTFQATTIVPNPKTDSEAANKLYVDQKVAETQSNLGDFASLKLANTFEKDQTFRSNAICNTPPTMPYHLANKEYVDALAGGIELPDNLVALDDENVWLARQDFSSGITVPDPENGTDAASKDYVDRKLSDVEVGDATTTDKGIVKLAASMTDQSDNGVTTASLVRSFVQSQSTDDSNYAKTDAANTFTSQNYFEKNITISSKNPIFNDYENFKTGNEQGRCYILTDGDTKIKCVRYPLDGAYQGSSMVITAPEINNIRFGNYPENSGNPINPVISIGIVDGYGDVYMPSGEDAALDDYPDSVVAGMSIATTTSGGREYFGLKYPCTAKLPYDSVADYERPYLCMSYDDIHGANDDCVMTHGRANLLHHAPTNKFDMTVKPAISQTGDKNIMISGTGYELYMDGSPDKLKFDVSYDALSQISAFGFPELHIDFEQAPNNVEFYGLNSPKMVFNNISSGVESFTFRNCGPIVINSGFTAAKIIFDHCTNVDIMGDLGPDVIIEATNGSHLIAHAALTSKVSLYRFSNLNDADNPATNASADKTSHVWSADLS